MLVGKRVTRTPGRVAGQSGVTGLFHEAGSLPCRIKALSALLRSLLSYSIGSTGSLYQVVRIKSR